jgi:hypothetical protein
MTTTPLTAQQIAEQARRDDLPAATYQSLVRSLTARRQTLKARLDSIESRNGQAYKTAMASGDPTQFAALNREAEEIDIELGLLCDQEARLYQLHARTLDRETIGTARQARKQLSALVESASKALTKYREARRQLTDAIEAMGGARRLCWDTDRAAFEVSEIELSRIVEVLYVDLPADRLAGAVAGLRQRICAPPAPIYSDGPPDLAAQVRDVMDSPFARRDRGV